MTLRPQEYEAIFKNVKVEVLPGFYLKIWILIVRTLTSAHVSQDSSSVK